jgi:hypothetical protein
MPSDRHRNRERQAEQNGPAPAMWSLHGALL